MTLSSVVIVLVSGTFLAQSRYYAAQTLNASVHDNARVAAGRVASELRSAMAGGFVVASPSTLTVRSPMVLMMVCDREGTRVRVHMEGGAASLDTDEVAGLARRDAATGAWEYVYTPWSAIDNGSGSSAALCAENGADTAWAAAEYRELVDLQFLTFGSPPDPGDLLMLFRETTFRIQTSALDTMTLGLYRQAYGGPLVEFATGMDTTAQFQYRTGGSSYTDDVTGSTLDDIDAVRIVADARLPARFRVMEDAAFGLAVNITLRNVP